MADIATSAKNTPCYLLKLPTELQLNIYELVVIEDNPLLINCPCDSSYRRKYREYREDELRWKKGELRPPQQPALTRTCRFIRENALPIFYKENIFRASYCHIRSVGINTTIEWLRMISVQNREMLRHFYFYDRNQGQDKRDRRTLQHLKDCEVFNELGGKMETLSSDYCCAHLVTFGEHKMRAGRIPIASTPEVPRLRTEGEV